MVLFKFEFGENMNMNLQLIVDKGTRLNSAYYASAD